MHGLQVIKCLESAEVASGRNTQRRHERKGRAMETMFARKVHLGDAVYVDYDGHGLVLTSEN